MSLIPAFEIGLWNAWILMLVDAVTMPLFIRIARGRGTPSPSATLAKMSRSRKVIVYASKLIYIPAFVYSVFLPLKLGTAWFYVGLPIAIVGLVMSKVVLANWATAPPDKPVTRGLYRYSRHPMYVAAFISFLGISIATASWVFLVFTIVITALSFYFAPLEEQACLEQYGDSYRDYMKRTPRFLGMPKGMIQDETAS
jgi:protein-S-isoprenylcysteine O-methyltransferase Ste14